MATGSNISIVNCRSPVKTPALGLHWNIHDQHLGLMIGDWLVFVGEWS